MTAKATNIRVKEHAIKMQKEKGLKRICTWIPDNEEAIASIKTSAKRLRKKHGTPLPND